MQTVINHVKKEMNWISLTITDICNGLISIYFLIECTESNQCTADDHKGVCDKSNNVCVGKLHCLMPKSRHYW